MKKLKKLLSIVLAVAMVMSLAVSVTATTESQTTYTITISNSEEDYTYAAYQIFAGDLSGTTLSNIVWGSGVDTTSQVSNKTLLEAIQAITLDTAVTIGTTSTNSPFSSCSTAAEVAEVLSVATAKDSEIATKFAEVVGQYLAVGAGTTSTYSNEYTISNLPAGYYLVKTTTVPEGATDTAYTAYILEVVNDVTVSEKVSVPSLTKTVDDVNDSTGETATGTSADYDIGDSVPFTLTATLGDSYYEKYDEYALTFHDTLSSGLSYNEDSVEVTVYVPFEGAGSSIDSVCYTYNDTTKTFTEIGAGTSLASGETYYTKYVVDKNDEGYSVKTSDINNESLNVVIADTNKLKSNSAVIPVTSGSIITVEYTATLETGASYQKSNEAYITYSNDPYSNSKGTSEKSKTYVYDYSLTITKTNSSGDALKDAGFSLYKLVGIGEFETDVTYYTYTNGVFTEVEGGYVSGTTYYILVDDEAKTGTGDNYNIFTWSGLDDGTYVLVESTTPSGYNTMEDLTFKIVAVTDEDSITSLEIQNASGTTISKNTADSGDDGDKTFVVSTTNGAITTTITNEAGSNLPETGGIGVTIFYVVGGILILAAAGVIVISRKKIKK